MFLEVCVDSVGSAVNAEVGGADRVELCNNLVEGGTTPSAGMIQQVRENLSIDLMVMIRPRGGDFLYSQHEIAIMRHDINVAKDSGANGVVLGCLTPEGDVDQSTLGALLETAEGLVVTFHRAFDMTRDPFKALRDLIALKIDRVLTSGQENSAPEGTRLIKQLVDSAGDKISIMAGGGIRPHNIHELIKQTKVKECHVSGRDSIQSQMKFRNSKVVMGGKLVSNEYETLVTSAKTIRSFRL